MLALSRLPGESITIDGNVIVQVVRVRGNRVTLGVEAPREIIVDRSEVHERRLLGLQREAVAAAESQAEE